MQCQNCGTANDSNAPICRSCGQALQAPARPEDDEPWQQKFQRLADKELGAPPRSVPPLLRIAARRLHYGALFSLIAGLCGGLAALLSSSPSPGVTLPCLLATTAFVIHLVRRRRALWLLEHGIAARAEVLETNDTHTSYRNSDIRYAEGWDLHHINYTGPTTKNVLRLWTPEGKSATFKIGGLLGGYGYQGGIFLLDPKDPTRRLPVESYGVPLRPGPDGAWKVWPQARKWVAIHLGVAALVILGGIILAITF